MTDSAPAPGAPAAAGPGAARGASHGTTGPLALMLGALGVVYGDIGTSPLYALQTVFSIDHRAVRPTSGDVYGVISLVFWSVTRGGAGGGGGGGRRAGGGGGGGGM